MNQKIIVSKLGGPEVLQLHDAEIPTPAADEIIIRVAYAGVGAVDTIMRSGGFKDANLQPPFTPGIEVSGTIQAVGDEAAATFKLGQPVAAIMLPDGGYAEYVRAKAVLSVPLASEKLLPAAASLVNYVTAQVMFTQFTRLWEKDVIAVHAASGGLGMACVQVAHLLQPDANITATVRDVAKAPALSVLGYANIVSTDDFLHDSQAAHYTLIVDPVGGTLRTASLAALQPYGKLLVVGNVSDDKISNVSSQQLWLEGKTVIGFNLALYASLFPEPVNEAMRAIADALADDKLPAPPVTVYHFKNVQDAHRDLDSGKVKGRVLLRFEI